MSDQIQSTLDQIQSFFDGHGEIKHIINVDASPINNKATCYLQKEDGKIVAQEIEYTPFLHVKDITKLNLYNGDAYELDKAKAKHGITITPLRTDNHPRLVNGFNYLITSSKSLNHIHDFLRFGGVDSKGGKNKKGGAITFALKPQEQFFISTGNRLFKGFEKYSELNKLVFDIETTGLNPLTHRVIQIGMKNNKHFQRILEVGKEKDDLEEGKIIRAFFYLLFKNRPAILAGYNSEGFDFDFLLKRAELILSKEYLRITKNDYETTYRFYFNGIGEMLLKNILTLRDDQIKQ